MKTKKNLFHKIIALALCSAFVIWLFYFIALGIVKLINILK